MKRQYESGAQKLKKKKEKEVIHKNLLKKTPKLTEYFSLVNVGASTSADVNTELEHFLADKTESELGRAHLKVRVKK